MLLAVALSPIPIVAVVLVLGSPRARTAGPAFALGTLFLAMAAGQWRKRPEKGEEPEAPRWMAGIESVSTPRAAALGVGLSAANPKNLALTLAASASIAQSGLDGADEAIAITVFVVLGSVTVAGAVLF